MNRALAFAVLATALTAGAAQAQQIPSYHHVETPRTDMAPRTYSQPMVSATKEAALSEMRVRVATKMVQQGRCDDALKLAQRQNDKDLGDRVATTCAAIGSPKMPS